jgi:multiple sugar transport system substrate-binding protein
MMIQQIRYSFALLLVATLTLAVGVGCKSSAQKEVEQAEAQGKTVIEFWHALSQEHSAVIEEFVAAFHEENPDILVQPLYQGRYDQLKLNVNNSLAAGSPPALSLMYEGWTTEFIENQQLMPIHELAGDDAALKEIGDDLYSGFREGNSRDGKLVTLPFNKSTFIVFYNKDKFAAAGYDEFPTTLEELEEATQKLVERDDQGDPTMFGLGLRNTLEPFTCLLFAEGGEYMSTNDAGEVVVVNTDEAMSALSMIDRLMNEHKVAYVEGGYMSGPFGNEKIGFYWGSSGGIPFVDRSVAGKFEIGTASLPAREGKEAGYLSQGTNIGVFNQASDAQQKAAWEFIKFLMRPDNAATWAAKTGYLPVRRAAMEEDVLINYIEENPAYQTCMYQLENLKFEPTVSYWEQVRADMIQNLESAYRDRKTPEEALADAEQGGQKIKERANR